MVDVIPERRATLPIKGGNEIFETARVREGMFTTTIELDSENVMKILRLKVPKSETDYTPTTHFLLSDQMEGNDPNKILTLLNLARTRKENYFYLRGIFGDIIPELRNVLVADTPSKELYKRKYYWLDKETLDKFPEQESSIMEIWENVDPTAELYRRDFNTLQNLYSDDNFRQQLAQFAQIAADAFFRKGVSIDICDLGGIRAKRPRENTEISEMDSVIGLLEDNPNLIAYPRNVTYQNGKIRFFDLFPFRRMKLTDETKRLLREGAEAIEAKDEVKIKSFVSDSGTDFQKDSRKMMMYYMTLLKYMGADFSRY